MFLTGRICLDIVNDLPLYICRFRPEDGRLTWVNDACCSYLEKDRDTIIGGSFFDLVLAGENDEIKSRIALLKSGTPLTFFEHTIMTEIGMRWQKWICTPVSDENGEVFEIQAMGEDITEYKWIENELRRSEERYRTIFENTGTATLIVEEDGTISLANTLFEQLTGYPRVEVEWKKSWREFVAHDDLARMEGYHTARLIDPDSAPVQYEFRSVTRSGEIRIVLVTVMIIPETMQTVASFLDITERKKAEERLRASEERYRSILENIEEGYFEVDLNGDMAFFNEAMLSIAGYSRDEMLGMNNRRYMTPETSKRVFETFNRIYRTGKPANMVDHEVVCKDGTTRTLEMSVSLIRKETGEPSGFRGVARDVTARKASDQKLRQSEELYRHILENMEDTYYEVDLSGTITFFNPAALKIIGYTPEELMGKNFRDLMDEDNITQVFGVFHQVFLSGEPTKAFDWELIRKDGTKAVIEASVSLRRDLRGKTTGFKGIIRDVTDSLRAQRDIRESERKYRMLAENVREVIWTTDYDLKSTYVSPSVENLLGYTPQEIMGIPFRKFVVQESYGAVKSAIEDEFIREKASEDCDPFRHRVFEAEQIRKDGSRIWTEVAVTHLLNEEGIPIGIIGLTRDISERKRMEMEKKDLETQLEMADRIKAVGTLAGGIAHDFNNLLMGIQGNASLVLMDIGADHRHYERLRNIEEYVQKGSDLTMQLLGYARGGKYEVKPTELGEFIRKSSLMFERTKKEIKIVRENQPGLWTVEVDQGQMEQVLLNLYVNAWQAMPFGGDLFIRTENVLLDEEHEVRYGIKAGRYVKISITDTGTGMDEETKKHIFEPFFTTREFARGTGLGLASAYGIVKNHGGVINVQSKKGEGTTFFIYLPASDRKPIEESGLPEEILPGGETILLVDDEDMILDVGVHMLESLGYTVITAHSGDEAIKIYRRNNREIDLVILDMIMPGMGGGQTFEELRKISPNVCVLLSSGYSLGAQAREIIEKGCSGFIQKPFSLKTLSLKLREILDKPDSQG